jgi:queuine tRNA-ribosyltransferase
MVPVSVSPNARLNMRNARHVQDQSPICEGCACPTCASGYSRSYIRHLFSQQEILGLRLVTLHNLHTMLDLVERARQAIGARRWSEFYARERAAWSPA